MSTRVLQSLLNKEIDKLNKRIDRKIIKGLSYRRDALTHKLLLSKLQRINGSKYRRVSVASLLAL